MTTIRTLLTEIEGNYFREYENLDQEITDLEYFSGHLKKHHDYSSTIFVCITPERRNYINRKPVKWLDGNEQIAGRENEFGLIVTEHPITDETVQVPQFIVPNSWEFLLNLSAKLRADFTKPVIAITGSAGKTSTRMMISHLFKEKKVLENRGNHNVRFAVPLYMSKLLTDPEVFNLEVSVNALNSYDTGSMSKLIKPDIALVTSIGEAHLSSLKDTKGVAIHKAKIFEGLKKGGTAIINKDMGREEFTILVDGARKREAKIYTYSLQDSLADVYVKHWQQKREYCELVISFLGEEMAVNLTVSSAGMISNALATLLVVHEVEGTIKPYLRKFETFRPLHKILEKSSITIAPQKKVTFIDDTHNASLPAMRNAIGYFNDVRPYYLGKSFLILGQIADLGDAAKSVHLAIKKDMEDADADYIFGYGEQFKEIFALEQQNDPKFHWFATLKELSNQLEALLSDDSLILAKGSVTGSDFQQIDQYIRSLGRNFNSQKVH